MWCYSASGSRGWGTGYTYTVAQCQGALLSGSCKLPLTDMPMQLVMQPVTCMALDSLLVPVYRLLTLPIEELALGPGFCSTSPAITNRAVTRIFRPCLSSCHHVRRPFSKILKQSMMTLTCMKISPKVLWQSCTYLIKPWPLHKKLKVNILYLKLPSVCILGK